MGWFSGCHVSFRGCTYKVPGNSASFWPLGWWVKTWPFECLLVTSNPGIKFGHELNHLKVVVFSKRLWLWLFNCRLGPQGYTKGVSRSPNHKIKSHLFDDKRLMQTFSGIPDVFPGGKSRISSSCTAFGVWSLKCKPWKSSNIRVYRFEPRKKPSYFPLY